jgi:hypothetical protein
MRINKKDDSRIRRKISSAMKNAQRVLTEQGLEIESPWSPRPGFKGSNDIEIELEQPNIFHIPVEMNLPLSWSRQWLIQASKKITFSSSVLTKHQERITILAPLLRSATEESLRTAWLLEEEDPKIRLARGLLTEMEGCWEKLRYFEEVDHGLTASTKTYLRHLQEKCEEIFPTSFKYPKDNAKIVGLMNQSYPNMTQLYIEKLPQMNKELKSSDRSGVYGETSSSAHATAGLADGRPGSFISGQFVFDDNSNLHDEGRIIGPACLAFAQSTNMMHSYLGVQSNAQSWIYSISDNLSEWCSLNGCEG